MKITKEELIKENAVLQDEVVSTRLRDEELRKTFAKVLGKYDGAERFGYGSSKPEPKDLTWWEITFHIGKLAAAKGYSNLVKENQELQGKLNETNQILHELKHNSER